MKIVNPEYQILTNINGEAILKHIELAGRICYKSENLISNESYQQFIKRIVKRGHKSVIEHFSISVRIITGISITRELNRHRLSSISESSTRFCNFSKDKFGNEITVISPHWYNHREYQKNPRKHKAWFDAMEAAEISYFKLLKLGMKPEDARGVLPLDTKTEAIYTNNLRQWELIFSLRCSPKAHPELRSMMIKICTEFYEKIPIIFDDVYEKYCFHWNLEEEEEEYFKEKSSGE